MDVLLVLLPVFAGVPGSETLFAICSLVVLLSVVLHGGSLGLIGRDWNGLGQGTRGSISPSGGMTPPDGAIEVAADGEGPRPAQTPEAEPVPVGAGVPLAVLARPQVETDGHHSELGIHEDPHRHFADGSAPAEAGRITLDEISRLKAAGEQVATYLKS